MAGIVDSHQCGQIIKDFLACPQDRAHFDAFFKLTRQFTTGFLRYLRALGHTLPLVEQSNIKQALDDLALDILGSFLRSEPNKPFVIIFRYFRQKYGDDIDSRKPAEACDSYCSLLFGYIRQELSRIRAKADPQVEKLKRRFRDILNGHNYVRLSSTDDRTAIFCLHKYESQLRPNRPFIERDQLLEIVDRAYLDNIKYTEWCYGIFDWLNKYTSVRNALIKHELIRAVIVVNSRHVLDNSIWAFPPNLADWEIKEKTLLKAKDETLNWISKTVLAGFVEKEKITPDHGICFRQAVDRYLLDLLYSRGVDLLPAYFREVMPKSEHPRYLDGYKHIFETTIHKAVEDFQHRAKKADKFGFWSLPNDE